MIYVSTVCVSTEYVVYILVCRTAEVSARLHYCNVVCLQFFFYRNGEPNPQEEWVGSMQYGTHFVFVFLSAFNHEKSTDNGQAKEGGIYLT